MDADRRLNKRRLIQYAILTVVIFIVSPLAYVVMSPNTLNRVQYVFSYACIPLSFLFLIISLVIWKRKHRTAVSPPFELIGFCFAILLCTGLSLIPQSIVLNMKARDEIKSIVNRIDINQATVKIEGTVAEHKDNIIKGIKSLQASSLKPSRRFVLQCDILYEGGSLRLLISPSSYEPDFYWVYYPKYSSLRNNAIGGFMQARQVLRTLMRIKSEAMKHRIADSFVELCKQIVSESKSLDEWYEMRSDDMFQSEKYCGGFESMEDEFTFSLFKDNGCEYWFQLSLEQVEEIAQGKLTTVDIKPANQ